MNEIAKAISEGFKLLKTVLDSSEIRRYKAAIDAGENYIRVNEREGEDASLTDREQASLLGTFRHRFFKYKQG